MANYDLTYEGSRVQNILDTGDELRDAGYIFRGEATPSTVPGTPTERVAYIGGPGTYTNFGSSITVGAGCICVFKYTGSAWSNQVINTGLSDAISSEASARQLGDSTLQGGINTVSAAITAINNAIGNGCVYAGIATPSSTPASGKVFYFAFTAGTYTNFNNLEVPQGINILKNNGSTWLLDSFSIIDDAPTQGSANLVKSGGVLNSIIQNGPAFDLSAYNAQGGVLATYADLNAALTALNALPADFKKGGMSMKFVLTSDNKYVKFFCTAQNFTTDVTKWQGVDVEPVSNSHNLVESGGVATSQLEEYIDYTEKTEALIQSAGGYWYSDNSYSNSGNYYRYFIKIPQGTTKVKVVYSDNSTGNKYAVLFLTELPADIRTSLDSSIIVGSTLNMIGENNIQVLNIPNNATYVVLTTRIELSAGRVMLNTNPFNVFPQKTQFDFGKYLSIDEYIPKGVYGKFIAVNGSVSDDNYYSISNIIKLPAGATLITKNVTNNSNHGIFLSSSEDISEATFTYLTTSTSSPNPKYTNTSGNEQMVVVCRRYVNDNDTAQYSIIYEDKADVVNSPQFIEYTKENELISEKRITINMLPFSKKGYGAIKPDGTYTSSSNWSNYVFKREPWMKYIRVKASTNGSGNPISYISKMWVDSSSIQYFIGYDKQNGTNVYTYGVIPDNCNCIFVSTLLTLSTDEPEIMVYGDSVEYPLLYDILKQNPRDEVMPRIISARRNLINANNVLSLIHYSDIHGDAVELKRIMRFHQYYNEYIDDIVDTGDVLGGGWSDPFVVESVPSAGIVLRSLGNHDTCVHEGSTYDWWAKTAQECYNRFYAPYISSWNCQYESGKCYFYKDYASNIRLVVIDAMHLDQTQIDWLNTTLSDAKSNSLGVILATHFTYKVVPFNTPFQSLHNNTSIMENPEGVSYGNVPSSVQTFIDNGGEFICYLSGHTHWDECGTIVNYPEQIQITIDTAYCGYQAMFGDTARAANCKSQDLFNVVTVDTDKKWIKLIRIGANVRSDMAIIDCATIDYANKVLITT